MFLKVLFQGNPSAHGLPSPLLHSHECSPEYGAVVVSDAHQRRYRRCVMLGGRKELVEKRIFAVATHQGHRLPCG
jgi:hypothetical protein